MKTRNNWSVWLAAAVLLVGALAAAPAQADNFSFTYGGCDGDTICVFPDFNGDSPDSVEWYDVVGGVTLLVIDVAAPFDTCFTAAGQISGYDSRRMGAYYTPDPDTTVTKAIISSIMVAIVDGVTVPENDSILIAVLQNDTSSTPGMDSVEAESDGNAAQNGTAYENATFDSIWYVPDPGYNGTDDFAYRAYNACGDNDSALVGITVQSNGLLAFDTCYYEWVDVCANSCDEAADSTLSVGDSFRVCANIPVWDLDELTAGWPHVDLPGIAGTGLSMEQNPDLDGDSTLFCWPGFEAES